MRNLIVFLIVILASFQLASVAQSGDIKGTVSSVWVESRKDIIVFIEVAHSGKVFQPPQTHPTMDQKDLTFVPHILPIVVGTTVDFPNSDKVQHNVFSPSKTKKFDLGSYPPGEFKSITFDQPGKVGLLCNVHPEMSGYIIVLNNPFFVLTDEDGKFVIPDVPAGKYKLSTWHKNLETVTKKAMVPAKGTVTVNFELVIGDPVNLSIILK